MCGNKSVLTHLHTSGVPCEYVSRCLAPNIGLFCHANRSLLTLTHLRYASFGRSLLPYDRSLLPYDRSLLPYDRSRLTLTHLRYAMRVHQ